MKPFYFFVCASLLYTASFAQPRVSMGIDLGGIRNFSPKQRFWAIGQTTEGDVHFSKRESLYTWLLYYTPGRFTNSFHATAKSPNTTPAEFDYQVKGSWRIRHFSLGWKHYFKGGYNVENEVNIYGRAGMGILFLKIENTFLRAVDTSLYHTPPNPIDESGNLNRLTWDLGAGAEQPLGANIFLYVEGRTILHSSSNPSPLLHSDERVPLPFMAHVGLRILFGD